MPTEVPVIFMNLRRSIAALLRNSPSEDDNQAGNGLFPLAARKKNWPGEWNKKLNPQVYSMV